MLTTYFSAIDKELSIMMLLEKATILTFFLNKHASVLNPEEQRAF